MLRTTSPALRAGRKKQGRAFAKCINMIGLRFKVTPMPLIRFKVIRMPLIRPSFRLPMRVQRMRES